MTRRFARIARLLVLPALLAMGVASAPAVSAGNPCFHGQMMPPSTTGPGPEVKLMPCAFQPTVTLVAAGTEVSFFNGPDFTHLITGASQEWGSPDVEVQPGETITYTFEEAGIYPYACVLHPGMAGAIVVGDLDDAVAAGSTSESTTTGGSSGDSKGGAAGTTTGEASVAGSSTAEASTTSAAASEPTIGTLALVGLGAGAGVIAGAAALWLALRRRSEGRGVLAS